MTTPQVVAKVSSNNDTAKVTVTHETVEIKSGSCNFVKIGLWIVSGLIIAMTIWSVVDSTKKGGSILTAFAVVLAFTGVVYGFLIVFGTIFSSARIMKWSYAIGIMLLGAQVIIFLFFVIWYAISDKKAEKRSVTGATVAWNTILLVCYIAAPFLIRCYIRQIDPVLHLKSIFEVARRPLSGIIHPEPGTTVITTTPVVTPA